MIKENFPSDSEANQMGGFLLAPFTFCRLFPSKGISLENDLIEVNQFLKENGYKKVLASQLDETYLCYTNKDDSVTVEAHGWTESFVVYITDKELEGFYHQLMKEG